MYRYKTENTVATYAGTSSTPQRAKDVLLLRLLDTGALFRVLRHEEQEGETPDGADETEHVEDGRPAAGETVRGEQTRERHRDHSAELCTCREKRFFVLTPLLPDDRYI